MCLSMGVRLGAGGFEHIIGIGGEGEEFEEDFEDELEGEAPAAIGHKS